MRPCPLCGATNWDAGILNIGNFPQAMWGQGIYYVSGNKKLFNGKPPVYSMACLNGGHIELYIDKQFIKGQQ